MHHPHHPFFDKCRAFQSKFVCPRFGCRISVASFWQSTAAVRHHFSAGRSKTSPGSFPSYVPWNLRQRRLRRNPKLTSKFHFPSSPRCSSFEQAKGIPSASSFSSTDSTGTIIFEFVPATPSRFAYPERSLSQHASSDLSCSTRLGVAGTKKIAPVLAKLETDGILGLLEALATRT